jgi:hypothetical protein
LLRERADMEQQIGRKLKNFTDYASKESLGQVHAGGFLLLRDELRSISQDHGIAHRAIDSDHENSTLKPGGRGAGAVAIAPNLMVRYDRAFSR